MGRKKSIVSKKSETTMRDLIREAKQRLPSERGKLRCEGCFNPRNTLTVKGNLNHVWHKEEIQLSDRSGVYLPCSKCKTMRFLSLGKFSLEVFLSDYEEFKGFVLLKDDKYNCLIGLDVSSLPLDLGEFTDG